MLRMLLTGELGSFEPGPALGEPAPDFTLTTHDGKQTVTLSDSRGKKPVVLIFGSFT
jgi:alkyl hydroperoxide reductase subunit AhpC